MKISAGRSATRAAFPRWSRRIAISGAILFVVALAAALLNNNVSFERSSKAQFVAHLDQALARSTDWALRQYPNTQTGTVSTPLGRALVSNSATAHMVVDSASLSPDSRMKSLASSFVDAWKVEASVFGRVVDPAIPAKDPAEGELQRVEEYQRWILYGAAPDGVPLSPQELEDMFAPDKYRAGKATHQLFALYFYRKSKDSTPEVERLMRRIEERIAGEAALDFRVTDLYLQRIAFLLAAGRPDLIRPRWVERALAAQQVDGAWLQSWHGWAPTPYRFSFADELPSAHATAQGMWICYMLKYRYPEWIERNYIQMTGRTSPGFRFVTNPQ